MTPALGQIPSRLPFASNYVMPLPNDDFFYFVALTFLSIYLRIVTLYSYSATAEGTYRPISRGLQNCGWSLLLHYINPDSPSRPFYCLDTSTGQIPIHIPTHLL